MTVLVGDCVDRMRRMDDASVDAIVCDPPYGLEFMGKEWDSFRAGAAWEHGGGFTKPGIGDRPTAWPSHSSTSRFGSANPTCNTCGGRARGAKKCGCDEPDWKPIGPRRSATDAPEGMASGGMASHMRAFQAWCETWAVEALRVLKPGGHLLAFGGTRTYHRLACAIEDCGFEIRDSVTWMYGSGFPKSLNVAKAIDKALGIEREVLGERETGPRMAGGAYGNSPPGRVIADVTEPTSPEAKQWDGWGTALKPSQEPIVVARKPLRGGVAPNVLEHGTGALNVDGTRIPVPDGETVAPPRSAPAKREGVVGEKLLSPQPLDGETPEERLERFQQAQRESIERTNRLGRWPANVVLSHAAGCRQVGVEKVKTAMGTSKGDPDGHGIYGSGFPRGDGRPVGYGDEDGLETAERWECVEGCPVAELDRQSGESASQQPSGSYGYTPGAEQNAIYGDGLNSATLNSPPYGDKGGASRFFYVAKASRAEREAGLGSEFEETESGLFEDDDYEWPDHRTTRRRNSHPTVKPIDLMRWLVRLVTPPAGLVLDPFAGSGTTGCAAALEGLEFVGIERDPTFARIAEARIRWWSENAPGTDTDQALRAGQGREERRQAGQMELL